MKQSLLVIKMTWINDDNFEKIIERMLKSFGIDFPKDLNQKQDPWSKSWYYGYTMTIGPDGKPIFKEFGNTNPNLNPTSYGFNPKLQDSEFREPLVQVDINKDEKKVKILVEMPGLTKDVIKINASDNLVKIKAEYESRKYSTEVPIEARIDPSTADATYNNGILDLSFELIEGPNDNGFNVEVK
jgi:HSP20 family protein